MKVWAWIAVGIFTWCIVSSFFAYDFMLKAEPARFLNQTQPKLETKSQHSTIKVDGFDYLVVESKNGIGVTFLVSKNNLKKLGQVVSEISDEMDAEKLNSIIQK
tara:strand:+ start:57369 stop:57680 length:312 start_codon:yes stop_codon:yes gene_type:complete